ncbi:hypothetical protein PR002_g15989 [Phytophthora rubi]|uniref:Uncharacterized protein n=1 Tax=Phytophthora rubi TaxID=129364 RepID=A0A6A3KXB5_9STRA|nr:hypothetical protein PR002_g15989 [Phytophthora rubi]
MKGAACHGGPRWIVKISAQMLGRLQSLYTKTRVTSYEAFSSATLVLSNSSIPRNYFYHQPPKSFFLLAAPRHTMSLKQASPTNDRDFLRLNGRNFIIWKTRVTAAFDGKNLLGFVSQVDYAGDTEVDLGPDEELNPPFSEDISDTLNRMGVPKADTLPDFSSSESSDGSSDGPTEDDGDVDMGQGNPPVIHSFAAQKQQELDRAEKLKAKSQRLSSKKLRLMEAKAKAFLIKTIDDQHVLLVKEKTTAFEIFQTICSKYEGSAVHGDPYYIRSYLMHLSYEEGNDLATFLYDLESAMKAASDSTNSVLSDEQKSLYLYHSLPAEWKAELAVWKGSRKFIPYEDLKRNIETKVQNELARNRLVLKQGTPESRETRAETAMQAAVPDQVLMPTPPKMDAALVSSVKCTYCYRDNPRHGRMLHSTAAPTQWPSESWHGTSGQFQAEAATAAAGSAVSAASATPASLQGQLQWQGRKPIPEQ